MKLTIQGQAEERQTLPKRFPRRTRWRKAMVIVLPVLALLVAAAGGYLVFRPRVQPLSLPALPAHISAAELGLVNWQDYQRPFPADPLSNPNLPRSPQVSTTLALLQDAAGQALIRQGQLERGLAYLQAATQAEPDNLRYANDYRIALRDHGRYGEEEVFFSHQAQLVSTSNITISLALVYVDEMRACPKPPDGLVCQAQDSSRSISVLDKLLTQHPYNIVARYARGLNHLYWPSLMGHLPKAQVDLQYAVALTRHLGSSGNAFIPLAYAALGDVFAKDGQTDAARNVWLNGKSVTPGASILDSRLGIPQDQLVSEENGPLRGLGVYVDTDLTIFWKSGR
jgi:tetratricopeptide (TPR) repeat protein